jgi:hypothetical protein
VADGLSPRFRRESPTLEWFESASSMMRLRCQWGAFSILKDSEASRSMSTYLETHHSLKTLSFFFSFFPFHNSLRGPSRSTALHLVVAAAAVALEARRSAAAMRKGRNEADLASTLIHVQRLREENQRPNIRSTYSKCWRLWRVGASPWRHPVKRR